MFNLILNKSGKDYSLNKINVKWIVKARNWGITLTSPKIDNKRQTLVKVNKFTFEVRNLPPKFIPMNELIPLFSECKLASFKAKDKKSSLVKVYIDKEQYITRTAGRLKIKNGAFKTNLSWLKKALTEKGLEDVTPEKGWELIK